ncbi:MAG: nucleotidyltransferase domain-containing protein [Planctomycetota bacterium]|nr:nucleotidyltransferase domain-containing protein [Planctomycetota bacterium]
MHALRDRLIRAITAGPPARFIVLFGSTVTGKMRPDSDVDLAWLPVHGDLHLARELEFQAALTLAAGREVDLVRLDHASTLCRLKWRAAGTCSPVTARRS